MVSHYEDTVKIPREHCNIGLMLAQLRSNLEICSLNSGLERRIHLAQYVGPSLAKTSISGSNWQKTCEQ